MDLNKRYQVQPWYIKLWRRRWYLAIPYWTLNAWLKGATAEFPIRVLWGLYTAMAQTKMDWYYTLEECRERWQKRIEEHKREKKRKDINEAINKAEQSGAYDEADHLSGSGAWLEDEDEDEH